MEIRKDPRVSVVMLTHNRVDEATRSLAHLLALPEQPRICVVDNGSVDDTAQVLKSRFPDIDIIRLEDNIGAAARNVGIAHAATPFVALCDDDTWWKPGALSRAADALDTHARLAIVTGRVLVGPEEREDLTCRRMAASPLPADGLPGPAILGFLAGASMIRRAAFLEVGGFEPKFFLGGEEALVAWDLAAAGWAMVYLDDVIIYHYPSRLRDADTRRRLLVRNAIWAAWLRRPRISAIRHTLSLIGSAMRDPRSAPGLLEAAAGLPWALRHRRVLPHHVEASLRLVERGE